MLLPTLFVPEIEIRLDGWKKIGIEKSCDYGLIEK